MRWLSPSTHTSRRLSGATQTSSCTGSLQPCWTCARCPRAGKVYQRRRFCNSTGCSTPRCAPWSPITATTAGLPRARPRTPASASTCACCCAAGRSWPLACCCRSAATASSAPSAPSTAWTCASRPTSLACRVKHAGIWARARLSWNPAWGQLRRMAATGAVGKAAAGWTRRALSLTTMRGWRCWRPSPKRGCQTHMAWRQWRCRSS
mmetsp:Transcript_26433/g.78499  ORF Transcript_26433/g.78499 Transcript_26433/m.78499 type:complete len:207 (+) Transcript_26433:1811-2431(+)